MNIKPPKNFLIKNIITDDDFFKNGEINIDDCIVDEIKQLWSKGIRTNGCCCGHNNSIGFIQVERTSLKDMLDLGYKWYHDYPEELGGKTRYDAFIPKSICNCKILNKGSE
jgi:hypothetical protein